MLDNLHAVLEQDPSRVSIEDKQNICKTASQLCFMHGFAESTPSIAESIDDRASYNKMDLGEVGTLYRSFQFQVLLKLYAQMELMYNPYSFDLHPICDACLRSWHQVLQILLKRFSSGERFKAMRGAPG